MLKSQLLGNIEMAQRKLGPQNLPEIPHVSKDGREKEAKVSFSSLLVSRDVGREMDAEERAAVLPVGTGWGRLWKQSCCNYTLISLYLSPTPHPPRLIPGLFCQGGRFIYDRIRLSSRIFPSRLPHSLAQGSQKWLLLASSMSRR